MEKNQNLVKSELELSLGASVSIETRRSPQLFEFNSHLPQDPVILYPLPHRPLRTMAETPRRMTTRTKNANQHPGQLVTAGTRKRRTKAQIAADNAEIAAKEAAELEALKGVIQRVADLERNISHEEENESTPRARMPPKLVTKGLSRTRSYAILPQIADKSDCDMGEDATESEDVYRPESASDAASESLTDNAHDTDSTDTAEGLPPKKKQKRKTTFRAEIKTINEVARMDGVVQSESASGDKATTTAGLPSKDITTCVLRHSYPGSLSG